MPSVLFVFTSANKTLSGRQTVRPAVSQVLSAGWYLPEAAHPYWVLAPHAKIDFAAPAGPNPEVDEGSLQAYLNDEGSQKFLKDETVKSKLANAKKLTEVNVKDYDAIFYVGGHGPVIDLANDPENAKLASQFYQSGKIVSAVCHAPAALVGAVDADGKSIVAGKKFTGFSNVEEDLVNGAKDIPFSLEDKLQALGGKYEKAAEPWGSHVVVDGNLLTGQNPASAEPLGQAILKALK
ncbi:putative chaperone protein HSP31 [Termitomyces sp. J132]|nr:putative chaperone protein HSP31 [Termitomyces sp. J132]